MHAHTLPLAFLVVLLLASCSSVPKNAITLDQYAGLLHGPAIKAREFRISCKVVRPKGAVTQFRVLTARPGQKVTAENQRDLIYPVAFDLPRVGADPSPGSYPVTPTTPTRFAMRKFGDVLSIEAHTRGAFVELSGSLVSESFTMNSRAAGEAVSPLSDSKKRYLLTYNKVGLPQFKRVENLLYVAGLPGILHTIHLEEANADLVITCEAVP